MFSSDQIDRIWTQLILGAQVEFRSEVIELFLIFLFC